MFVVVLETFAQFSVPSISMRSKSLIYTHHPPRLTLGVNVLRQLQGIRVGQVGVCWGDSQDQAAFSADELHDHVSDLLLDVCRLVSNWNLGDPRQVDQSQIQNCR